MNSPPELDPAPLPTGISGMDDILRGGFPADCVYMVSGTPGTGKTTLALQFLLEGVRSGESCLYVTLSETRREIEKVAVSHGWDLTGLNICELIPTEGNLSADAQLTVFNPSEFELGETTQAMIAEVDRCAPQRVVLDSLSELRLVAQNPLRYRRQILALKQYFAGRDCTVLMLDDCTGSDADNQLESIAHGVVSLEHLANQYGAERRRLRVVKLRGVAFRGGFHDFTIKKGGLDVFPRLVASEHRHDFEDRDLPSGIEELDALLCGGLPAGTSTLMIGPAGTGKSTISTRFAVAAANRGERAVMFVFDENIGTFRSRSRKLRLGAEDAITNGLLTVQQIDPAELSSGEFSNTVRRAVEGTDGLGQPAKVIVVDSLNGYLNAMPEEKFLTAQLHELLAYLGQNGVVTIMTVTQAGMVGVMQSPVDTTYLADNVILYRFFEARGQVRRAISVVKKRSGKHELTIRELNITEEGVQIGPALSDFQGILTGVPTFHGKSSDLLQQGGNGN
ncbi:ATPase domain-containing protein [Lacipirellula limnantheis]|uniref:non-specific serine/threonine protein kinase n=1 Tax=Lacipirellula limnantheis TaxID=2528024 RepID=A0A517U3C4_9BACT|nr:ATPase domain-containing protein [Lacipirellula limnantheis]QDT75126.1 Circadian clock protein kinase KaiC [Lacipirellula limnantheis]